MEEPDFTIFCALYREAYARCFSQPFTQSITETESKLFYQQILEHTGLTVGWRSLKNYSFFVLNNNGQQNPSVASMDTLARYVLKAPYTNDIARKNDESHHPYWFLYREKHINSVKVISPLKKGKFRWLRIVVPVILIGIAGYLFYQRSIKVSVTESFTDLTETGLHSRGWQLMNVDTAYWGKRSTTKGSLTLFTLPGDNWPDSSATPAIRNLLLRKLPQDCFTAELQMQDFFPAAEWQQAGIFLLQDSSLLSPSIRVSLAYNDFFGGFKRPKEVLVQAIYSPGHSAKPEEFAHAPVLTLDSAVNAAILHSNLKQTALRIEKRGNHYRFLYAGGADGNSAFKELATKDFALQPQYIAIFAIKGRVASTPVVPVTIKRFALQSVDCN